MSSAQSQRETPRQVRPEEMRFQLREARDDAESLWASLTPEQVLWQPDSGRWSVAQMVQHMGETHVAYQGCIGPALDAARRAGKTGLGPYPLGPVGRWFAGFMEPPPKRRVPSPKKVEQTAQPDPEQVLPAYLAAVDGTLALVDQGEGLDLGRIRFATPFVRLFRLRVSAAICVLAAHDRRHLWLAREVMDDALFPSAPEPSDQGSPASNSAETTS